MGGGLLHDLQCRPREGGASPVSLHAPLHGSSDLTDADVTVGVARAIPSGIPRAYLHGHCAAENDSKNYLCVQAGSEGTLEADCRTAAHHVENDEGFAAGAVRQGRTAGAFGEVLRPGLDCPIPPVISLYNNPTAAIG